MQIVTPEETALNTQLMEARSEQVDNKITKFSNITIGLLINIQFTIQLYNKNCFGSAIFLHSENHNVSMILLRK